MILELKHLAPYLPYGLGVEIYDSDNNYDVPDNGTVMTMGTDLLNHHVGGTFHLKPLLRPLSDLTIEIEHNGEKFVPIEWIENEHDIDFNLMLFPLNDEGICNAPYFVVEKLFEWHFDVFGLIDQGLAKPIQP